MYYYLKRHSWCCCIKQFRPVKDRNNMSWDSFHLYFWIFYFIFCLLHYVSIETIYNYFVYCNKKYQKQTKIVTYLRYIIWEFYCCLYNHYILYFLLISAKQISNVVVLKFVHRKRRDSIYIYVAEINKNRNNI